MNDGDSKTYTQKNNTLLFPQREKTSILQRYITNVSDVLSTIRLRCPIQIDNGSNRVILDSRYRFLFYFGMFLYLILFTYEILK